MFVLLHRDNKLHLINLFSFIKRTVFWETIDLAPDTMSRPFPKSGIEVCADCSNPDPTWVSINRGVLLCDGCCSVHLSLGRHVSQIKSLKKSSWSSPQLTMVLQLVNCGANNIWEHSLLVDPIQNRTSRRKPNPRDPIHPVKADFIRAKYQFLAYVNKHKDIEGNTVDDFSKQLHSSVRTGNLETSLRLLAAGADPNYFHPDKGNTPLHVAAVSNQAAQIELLLVYGADPGLTDINAKMAADVARSTGFVDLADRLIESQYELTDGLAFYLCNRKPDHRAGQHFIIPEVADSSLDLSELAKAAKKKLQALSNHLFEELAMDVYDEVDRRENERIWLVNQTFASSDRQIVPFLPANPEFSATRNQGRQKLAKFNKREFATLIIDILNDAKRRYAGLLSPSGTVNRGHKEKDKSNVKPSGSGAKMVNGAKPGAGAKSGSGAKLGNLSDDEPLYDSVCSDEDYASIGDNQSVQDGAKPASKDDTNQSADSTCDLAGVAASTSDENFKKCFAETQRKLRDFEQTNLGLIQSNMNLKEEVQLLQNMVKKLLQENRLLRCGTSPVDVPSSLNGHEVGLGYHYAGCRWSIPEPNNPQWLMYEGRDFPSPPKDLPALTGKSDGDSHTTKSSGSGTRAPTRDSVEITPTDVMPPPFVDDATLDSAATNPLLPTQDVVVKKTEKITRNLQELFQSAQECKHDCYASCVEKIHASVAEMVALFPAGSAPESMQNALDLLVAGAERVHDLCTYPVPELNGVPDYRLHTQDVIKSAYDIAKAAKQLVILFE